MNTHQLQKGATRGIQVQDTPAKLSRVDPGGADTPHERQEEGSVIMATVNTAMRAVDRLTEATNALNDPAVFQAAKHMGITLELRELVWRVGNLAAQIDPYAGFPEPSYDEDAHPFGTATERGNA